MTIKQELLQVMKRIAASTSSGSATAIILCEGEARQTELYGVINHRKKITLMSGSVPETTVLKILTYLDNETETTTD